MIGTGDQPFSLINPGNRRRPQLSGSNQKGQEPARRSEVQILPPLLFGLVTAGVPLV
jgi:hypothetical protein